VAQWLKELLTMAVETLVDVSSSNATTYIVFGVISLVVYVLFLRPLFARGPTGQQTPQTPINRDANGAGRQVRQQQRAAPNRQGSAAAAAAASRNRNDSDDVPTWHISARKPSHATKTDAVLVDGMISFRHSTAATYEALLATKTPASTANDASPDGSSKSSVVAVNRKDRAKVLSRLLSLDKSSPPPRGTTVVVSIPSEEVDCAKLRRVLYLLATYFNLVVVLSVGADTSEEDIQKVSNTLRGSDPSTLPLAVLPEHRVVAAQSRTGRIALVRQLGRVELVLDHDPQMEEELGRFGFKVFVYGSTEQKGSTASVSRLAAQIMD
jgi:hypothetical protein